MLDCRGRLESDISECRDGDDRTIGTPNRFAPFLFSLAAAFLAASLLSGCGSGGGEAKADVQSESRGMPSDAGTGAGNEGNSEKKDGGSEKKGGNTESDTAGGTADGSTGNPTDNPGTASVPDGYENGGEIALAVQSRYFNAEQAASFRCSYRQNAIRLS